MHPLRAFPLASFAGRVLRPDAALRCLVQAGGERPFLLDGAADADGLGRYSYAGCCPRARFRVTDPAELSDSGVRPPAGKTGSDDRPPLSSSGRHLFFPPGAAGASSRVLAPAAPLWRQLEQKVASWAPLVAVGLLDYELGRVSERLPRHAQPHGLYTAAVDFAAYDAIYRYDAAADCSDILAVDETAAARLCAFFAQEPSESPSLRCGPLRSETSADEYARRVQVVLSHLRAGDCYQVNLCRRLRAALPGECALAAYLRLRQLAPAPLGCYLQLEPLPGAPFAAGPVLLSNSPELLLRLHLGEDARVAETRPIKGTRRRSDDPAQDGRLRQELLLSAKDRAEHLMIVDLLRNDLGRIAEVGSVEVAGFLRCVELPTVHHLVSTVLARPAAGIGLSEILHALIPGGSITGAPKVAAMTLIDELEPQRRGPFYGAVGWLGEAGGELSLCIRTAVAVGDELVLSVGGGIVLDSTPEGEWLETEAKAAAWKRALT